MPSTTADRPTRSDGRTRREGLSPFRALHFTTVVWGRAYRERFLDLALPSSLSPGNFPAVAGCAHARYRIYTPPEDAEVIRASRAYRTVSRLLPIEFCPLDAAETAYKHDTAAACQGRALVQAAAEGAALIVLPPDAVWSDGTFARLTATALRRKPAVLLAGIRVRADSFAPAFIGACPPDADGAATAPGRRLVRLALDHIHPLSGALFWDATRTHSWPSHLYWRVGAGGFVARCFHLHPFLLNPAAVGSLASGATVDGELLRSLSDGGEAPHVVTDSDDAMVCEVSDPAFSLGEVWRPGGLRPRAVAGWARVLAHRQHRRFFRERIRVHTGGLSAPEWDQVEAESDRVVRRVEQWVRVLSVLRCYDEPLKRLRRRLRPWRERWGLR